MTTGKTTRKSKAKPAGSLAGSGPAAPDGGLSIVGLGASAGGLEAFEQFFRHLPPDTGLAFVLVSHLDPSHASILTDILQRSTAMTVLEAKDKMAVEPNHVYVVPPNRDMAIFHGCLQLSVPELPRGQRMPIDAFLRSLAEDQGDRAIGIILSGTGTDGTLGLRAILGAGGVTLVQEPTDAKYDGMPKSAIKGGYATKVLVPEKMPQALVAAARLRSVGVLPAALPQSGPLPGNGMNRLLMLLRSATGHDFSLYKRSTIGRRIERRMALHDVADIEVYARYLKEHPAEIQALFRELLINVTSFFRDPDAFEFLKREVLRKLLDGKPDDYVIRVWVAGCSTGEEAYSIAMLLREVMDDSQREFKVQLYGTDLDDDAIAFARVGLYPPNIVSDVPPERLRRFFLKEDVGYRIKKEIREMVVFAIQNVIKDPPFTKLDLLCCRNLMIYLEPELQNRLIQAFHHALKPEGVLFLSTSESIGSNIDLFSALSRKWKLYQTVPSPVVMRAAATDTISWAMAPGESGPESVVIKAKETDFGEITRRVLLQACAPASVLVEANGDILYVHGDLGKYLRPAPGQPTLNVVEMAREGLQLELRAALQAATRQGAPILGREVSVKTNGGFQMVSVSLRPLADHGSGRSLLLLSFQDLNQQERIKPKRRSRAGEAVKDPLVEELERELAYSRESLKSTIEEQQASNEELKSTNEELQSTNEELQSTNEELETSKEEMQSVNEELITVNAELQSKIEQLAGVQNDMKNLLDNINIGIVFLDENLMIRRFTRDATKVFRMVATDVGRPLADIKSNLKDDELIGDAEAVLDSLVPREREVQVDGIASYLVRTQPYRTLDNVIEGVVLTFTDITKRVAAETAENWARQLAEGIVDTVREALAVLDGEMKVVSASRSFYRRFGTDPKSTIGRSLFELGNRQLDIPALRQLLEGVLPGKEGFEDFSAQLDLPQSGPRRMLLNARRVVNSAEARPLILLAMEEAV